MLDTRDTIDTIDEIGLTPAERREIAIDATKLIVRAVIRAGGGIDDARAISRFVDRAIAAGAEPSAAAACRARQWQRQ